MSSSFEITLFHVARRMISGISCLLWF